MGRRTTVRSLIAILIATVPCAWAQMTAVTNSTSTPIPGAGHDYIKMLSETVDPANGSVSLRLHVPTPRGRGLTMPFSFAYDSNGVHFPVGSQPGQATSNGTITVHGNAPAIGGWSYAVPMLSYSSLSTTVPNQLNCTYHATAGYVLQDASGGRHSLRLSHADTPSPSSCSPYYFEADYGGDDYYQAELVGGTFPVVVDPDGTVYTFSNTDYVGAGEVTSVGANVEDRNGNLIAATDTLGRTPVTWSGFGVTGNTVTVSGLSAPYSLTWGTASYNFNPPFESSGSGAGASGCSGISPASGSQAVIKVIALPNGSQYKFNYDSTFGQLSQITYPGGGYVQYTWGYNSYSALASFPAGPPDSGNVPCEFIYSKPAITDRYVSFNGSTIALHQHFTYTTLWTPNTGTWSTKTTTVTTTDEGRQPNVTTTTTYTYTSVPGPSVPNIPTPPGDNQIPVEQKIVYQDGGGTTLRTVNKTWFDQYELATEQDTLENGVSSLVKYAYGPGAQVTEKDEYDFGSGSSGGLLRKTLTNYQVFPATPIYTYAASIYDRPCQTIVYDSSGTNRVAETDYFYDGSTSGTPCAAATTQALSGSGSYTGHDETKYGTTATPARANVTRKTQWLTTGSSPIGTYNYDETGQVTSATDACGNATCSDMAGSNHTTTYSYADDYSNGAPPNNTNAYLTKITDALGHVTSFAYGYSDGQLTSSTDVNSQVTHYKYNTPPTGCADGLDRLGEIDYPDTGKTTYCYNDASYNASTPSPSVTTTKAITSNSGEVSITAFDGIGHVVKTTLTTDPDCPTGDIIATSYDGLGRVYTESNPYCTTSDSTYGLTTYLYDPLGRTKQVTHPDNTYISTSYTGRATEVIDEGNGTTSVARVSQVDGLGRLVSVCEVSSTTQLGPGGAPGACGQDIAKTGFLTSYSYDPLDNLLTVSQGSLAQRTFAYDSLSRLLCAANPETGSATCPTPDTGTYTPGTTRYGYDANGNLFQRTRPAPNQTSPSTTVTTTYSYDSLNRLTQKAYSDGVTPPALFGYDQTNITMGSQQFTISNSISRLSWTCVQVGSSCPSMTASSYDPMGRIAEIWQPSPVYNFNMFVSYNYDLIGDEIDRNMTGDDYASGYNTAGRLTAFTATNYTDANNPANLLANVHYDPMGHMISGTLANGLSLSWGYDSRGRVKAMEAGTNCSAGACSNGPYGYLMTSSSNQPGYAPNGNVLFALDSANGFWAYTYDDLDRLATSTCSGICPNGTSSQAFSYRYDRYGNRWNQTVTAGSGPQPNASFTGAQNNNVPNNHMDGFSYDATGNLLNDGNHNYAYDAENRIKSVDNGATTYTYNANGQRVSRTTGSARTDIIYDREGQVIRYDESASQGSPATQIYVGGMHLGGYVVNGTNGVFNYAHADWLGTERAYTNLAGAVCETIASLPFGDGQVVHSSCTATADVSPMHFTGKERDTESGLDYFGARHYASTMGRWMSPDLVNVTEDRVVKPANTLNKYVYGGNNPLKYIDPDGQDITYFYDPGFPAGHAVLFAYNQATGASAIESFGPKVSFPVWTGESNYDMGEFSSAQGLRDNYASLTIQTTPELSQQVIDFIHANPDPSLWTFLGPNCSSEVQKILAQFKLNNPHSFWPGFTPKALWYSLLGRYNPSQAVWGQMTKPVQGHDYGHPRYDMFDLLWQSLPQSKEIVTHKLVFVPCGAGSGQQCTPDTPAPHN